MKAINKTAQKIFDKLVALIPKGETAVKVDNTDGTFMAVHVEKLHSSHLGDVYSVAHYFVQMGDMCCDPDMTFVVGYDGRAYPLSFEIQGGFGARYEASVRWWLNETRVSTTKEKLDGLAFSILVLLDGGRIDIPGMTLIPGPHPEDKEYHKEQCQNWWPDDEDIGGALHEEWHK